MRWSLPFAALGLGCLLYACAEGSTEGGFEEVSGGSGGNFVTAVSSSSSASSSSSSSSSSGVGGMGEGGMGEGGDEPGTCTYTSPNDCAGATEMSSIAGDENDPPSEMLGTTSSWFKIHVTEEVSSVFDEDLSYTVTLEIPDNMVYELYVHEGEDEAGPNCSASPQTTMGSGNILTVNGGWGDSQGIGGEDNSRWLSIEVRYISGIECGASAVWKLSVEGHT